MQRKTVVRFVLIALSIHAVLTLGWAGFGKLYASGFRAALRGTLVREMGVREVDVPDEQSSSTVTRIIIANRTLLAADGTGPIRNLDLPNATFCQATALLIALSLATPRRWLTRLLAAVMGFLVVQAFVAATVSFALWNEGRFVSLSAISPAWETTTDRLESILAEQVTLFVPVLAWLAGLWPLFKRR